VLAALGIYTQAGRAIFDLNKQVYRVRELSREPLPMDKLRFSNEREQAANRLVSDRTVTVRSVDASREPRHAPARQASRTARAPTSPNSSSTAIERLASATCTCNFYTQNKLYKGPCEHILALRIQHRRSQGS
jgi:hypothetical protein